MQDLELAENISVTVPSQVRVCEGEGEHNNRLRCQDLLVHRSGYEGVQGETICPYPWMRAYSCLGVVKHWRFSHVYTR